MGWIAGGCYVDKGAIQDPRYEVHGVLIGRSKGLTETRISMGIGRNIRPRTLLESKMTDTYM